MPLSLPRRPAPFREPAATPGLTPGATPGAPADPPAAPSLTAPSPADAAGATLRAPDGMVRNATVRATPLSRAQVVERAKRAPVPQRVQLGPTCGLYALGMVMDAWNTRDPQHPTALVQEADRAGRGLQYTRDPTTGERILEVAQQKGFTAVGEMFTAHDLAATAAHFGYQAATHHDATLDDLYRVLDAGHPAIVAFDVDYNGNPTVVGGDRAHYAVIQGYFDDGGKRYLVARHGWGVQRDHVWEASAFDASWRGLQATNFYGAPGDGVIPDFPAAREPAGLALPDLGGGLARIREALAAKIVEVVPHTEPLVGGTRA